jgi:hypothetical protein
MAHYKAYHVVSEPKLNNIVILVGVTYTFYWLY